MATQRRKSSVQKRRSSMKRKYMKSRKLRGGLFGIFGKKAGEGDVTDAEPQEEVKKDEGMLKGVMDTVTNILPDGDAEEAPGDGSAEEAPGKLERKDATVDEDMKKMLNEDGEVEGGKKKKRKGTKKKKGTKKRKTAKKAKKSKKKKGKK